MRISEVNVYFVRPRWGFVEIVTDGGLTGWGEAVLEGHAELRLSGSDHRFRAVIRRLYDLDLKARFIEEALFLRYIDACVIRIGSPVENEGDLRLIRIVCAFRGLIRTAAAAGQRQAGHQGRHAPSQ